MIMHGASNNMELINANQLRLETLSEKAISEANLVNLLEGPGYCSTPLLGFVAMACQVSVTGPR